MSWATVYFSRHADEVRLTGPVPENRNGESRAESRESVIRNENRSDLRVDPRVDNRISPSGRETGSSGTVEEPGGDPSGSSNGTETNVGLRTCGRISRFSIDEPSGSSPPRSSDRECGPRITQRVIFGSHKLTTSVASFRSELGPRPDAERTRVPRGLRLRSMLPRGLLASGEVVDSL